LPTETEDDISEIANLIQEILSVARRANSRAKLSVSVSTYVPKSHTPFQWERQLTIEEIQDRQRFLIGKIGRNSRIDISFHSPQVSFLEGAFARGDRRLGKVLLDAHKLGCKLDGWTELFDFNKWMKAFERCDIEPSSYNRSRAFDEILPWDHIDSRISRDFLLAERERAYNGEMTPDCRNGECSDCGICDGEITVKLDQVERNRPEDAEISQHQVSSDPQTISDILHPISKLRYKFIKGEEVKYISHLDLINVFTRAFRRAGIPIAYSHGFNPHPKISFSSALPLGTLSEAEYADIELDEDIGPEDFMFRVNAELPPGVKILEVQRAHLKSASLMAQTGFASYTVRLHDSDCDAVGELESKIQSIVENDHIMVHRQQKSKKSGRRSDKKDKLIDIRELVKSIELSGCLDKTLEIRMTLGDGISGKVRPEEIINLLFGNGAEIDEDDTKFSTLDIVKTDFFIKHQGQFFSPMEKLD